MAVGTISEARIRANQANARKSTGPITAEGKAASSGNAVKHGLSGQGTVLLEPDEVTLEERLDAWRSDFSHLGPVASWLLRDLVTASVQVDAARRLSAAKERRDRREAAESWDTLRRIEAEELGSRLAEDPARTVLLLERTPHGCDWLIGRWRLALDRYDPYSPESRVRLRAILDLLGVPVGLEPVGKLDPQALLAQRTGKPASVRTWQQAGQEEIRRLGELRDRLADGQDLDRKRDAERGEILSDDANARLITRYESKAVRRFDRRFAQLRAVLGGAVLPGATDAEIPGTCGAAVALEGDQLQCPPHIPPQRSGVRSEGARSTEPAPPDLANASLPSPKPTPLSAAGRTPADADKATLPSRSTLLTQPRNRQPRRPAPRVPLPTPRPNHLPLSAHAPRPNEPTCHSGSGPVGSDDAVWADLDLTGEPVSPIPADDEEDDPARWPGGPRRCSATNAARRGSGSSASSAGPGS